MPTTLPAVHALHLIELAKRWGVNPLRLTEGILEPQALESGSGRISRSQIVALVDRARRLTGEPGLGIHLGLQMRISAHGFMGFAAMASSTLGEALKVVIRYGPTRTDALGLKLLETADSATVVLEERGDFGSARDVVVLALLLGLVQIANALTGKRLDGRGELSFQEPPYLRRFRALLPIPLSFGRRRNQLVFAREVLELPLTLADPEALRLATAQCEQELRALHSKQQLPDRVRAFLRASEGRFPSLEQTARHVHLSGRTLKRQLAMRRTSFRELLDEERRARAMTLLGDGALSIEQIAEELGYTDVSNFRRAFLRLTGRSPAAVRRRARSRSA